MSSLLHRIIGHLLFPDQSKVMEGAGSKHVVILLLVHFFLLLLKLVLHALDPVVRQIYFDFFLLLEMQIIVFQTLLKSLDLIHRLLRLLHLLDFYC